MQQEVPKGVSPEEVEAARRKIHEEYVDQITSMPTAVESIAEKETKKYQEMALIADAYRTSLGVQADFFMANAVKLKSIAAGVPYVESIGEQLYKSGTHGKLHELARYLNAIDERGLVDAVGTRYWENMVGLLAKTNPVSELEKIYLRSKREEAEKAAEEAKKTEEGVDKSINELDEIVSEIEKIGEKIGDAQLPA